MDLRINMKSTSNWGNGGNGEITITNISGKTLNEWNFNLTLENFQIDTFWNLTKNGSNTIMNISPCLLYTSDAADE
jgi:hypothetical protein